MALSPTTPTLTRALADLAARVAIYRHRGINEQATKNAFISPLLSQLGWDIHDLDMVTPEWRPSLPGFRGNPVDYALLNADGARPVALVEAKALGERLDLHASQAASYAQQAGVEWAILTNGDEWRVYRAGGWGRTAPLPQWLVLRCTLSDDGATELLSRLACAELRDGAFGRWARMQQDLRELKGAFEGLTGAPDPGLAELLGRDLAGGAARVRELWPHVRATLTLNGSAAAVADEMSVVSAVGVPSGSVAAAPGGGIEASAVKGPSAPEVDSGRALDGVWIPGSTPPAPGTKPHQVKVFDQIAPVKSWAGLLEFVVRRAAAENPARFALALEAPEFARKKSRRLGATNVGMRTAKAVGEGFVEVNLSAGDCVEAAREALEFISARQYWYSVVAR